MQTAESEQGGRLRELGGLGNAPSPEAERLGQLARGTGFNLPDVNTDPEAVSFNVAAQREQEANRQAEADRLGASGVTGSGAFDARVAQLREQAGEKVAGFRAALTGRRRTEQLGTAQLSAQQEAARRADRLNAATLGVTAGGANVGGLRSLIAALMGQQARY
ncbi:MAG: hypothetical protein ACREJC_00125 [Tepidisphaeraceae bacterium]